MQSRKMTVYVTTDGSRFFNQEEATSHEIRPELVNLMTRLCPGGFPSEFLEAILANRRKLLNVLGCRGACSAIDEPVEVES